MDAFAAARDATFKNGRYAHALGEQFFMQEDDQRRLSIFDHVTKWFFKCDTNTDFRIALRERFCTVLAEHALNGGIDSMELDTEYPTVDPRVYGCVTLRESIRDGWLKVSIANRSSLVSYFELGTKHKRASKGDSAHACRYSTEKFRSVLKGWRAEVETVLNTLVDDNATAKFNRAALNLIRRFPAPVGSLAAKYDARWMNTFRRASRSRQLRAREGSVRH